MKKFKRNKDLIKCWLSQVLQNDKLTYEEQLARNILRLNRIKLDNKTIKKIVGELHHE